MRFLFLTIQGFESDFYGRVGRELSALGHHVSHLTVSRRAAARHRAQGIESESIPELIDRLGPYDVEAERARIARRYAVELRELYRTDPEYARRSEHWSVRRTIDIVRALERVLDERRPEVLVPEVGRETPRIAAHHLAHARGIRTFFLLYTIFPNPLRLYVDTLHAPIVQAHELRPLSDDEQHEVDEFRERFVSRAAPIRPHRQHSITARRLRRAASYLSTAIVDRGDNEYLHPLRWTLDYPREIARARRASREYASADPARPFVYFPLHDTEDYKIKRVIPEYADQTPVVHRLAESLLPGYELVLKEHPGSVGRNSVSLLRALRQHRNVRLVDPRTSSHELIRSAEAVAVISSTVGLEALLYRKPVLTLGRPFYSGYGITIDVDTLSDIPAAMPQLLSFRPDPERIDRFLHAAMRTCLPGAPVLVDNSDENAVKLAASLDCAAQRSAGESGAVARVIARPDA